ncbi:MAG TPA: hypothetical protein VNZ53_20910 [Steroidobacteraceae bacterium]|jgi:hypothetical protein|nr:hypothetical protein [Steroidobacteraceae bacterium]
MYKIELTRNGRVIETHPVNSTSDVFQIERKARQLQAKSAGSSDAWRIVNESGQPVKTSNGQDNVDLGWP